MGNLIDTEGLDQYTDEITTFTSGDSSSPSSFADIAVVASKEKPSSLFQKLSQAIANIRWLKSNIPTIQSYTSSQVFSSLYSPDTNHNLIIKYASFVNGYKYGKIKIVTMGISLRTSVNGFGYYANAVGDLTNEFKPETNPKVESLYNISGLCSTEGMTTGQGVGPASGQASLISSFCIQQTSLSTAAPWALSVSLFNASSQAITDTSSVLCTVWCVYI